jgi:DNA-binding Lrp family transcriptional regulator
MSDAESPVEIMLDGRDPELPEGSESGEIALDGKDLEILNIIQDELPLEPKPFAALGARLGLPETEVIDRVRRMKARGVIRALGPVLETKRIGYVSILVAMKVPPEGLDETAALVGAYDEVTHSYGRDHDYNFWFTVTAESELRVREILRTIAERTGIEDIFPLPAREMFKIKVKFEL